MTLKALKLNVDMKRNMIGSNLGIMVIVGLTRHVSEMQN